MSTQNAEYQALLPIAREVREALKPLIHSYRRVYTEPRKDGLRSKFYVARRKGLAYKPLFAVVEAFNEKYPEYEFELDSMPGYWTDYSIRIKTHK